LVLVRNQTTFWRTFNPETHRQIRRSPDMNGTVLERSDGDS
jgi:hypothetical protein